MADTEVAEDQSTNEAPAEESANQSVLEESSDLALALEAIYDIPVEITVVLGKSRININDLLNLDKGSVVELNRRVGESVDIYVNDRLVAKGEIVIVEDNIGITMTEVFKAEL